MKKPMHFCFLIHLSRVYLSGDIRQKSIRHHVYIESRESVEEKRKKNLLLEIDFCFREQQQGGYRLSIIGNPIQFLNVRPILYNGPNIGHVSESQSKEESNRNHLWRGDGRVESSNSNLLLLLLLLAVGKCRAPVDGCRAAARGILLFLSSQACIHACWAKTEDDALSSK
jgi:hypothetical protein